MLCIRCIMSIGRRGKQKSGGLNNPWPLAAHRNSSGAPQVEKAAISGAAGLGRIFEKILGILRKTKSN
jgi:hypothetical protein